MNDFSQFRAKVITVSTRSFNGVWKDTSGPAIVEKLTHLGLNCLPPEIVPDGDAVRQKLITAVDEGFNLIITTGGTGLSPTDLTPEMTSQVIEKPAPGIAELIRNFGLTKGITNSMLSRGIAGVSKSSLIINFPGSLSGVNDALMAIEPILLHALEQIAGSDHIRRG